MKEAVIVTGRNGAASALEATTGKTICWAFCPHWVKDTALMLGYTVEGECWFKETAGA
jgi:hypothetical protein